MNRLSRIRDNGFLLDDESLDRLGGEATVISTEEFDGPGHVKVLVPPGRAGWLAGALRLLRRAGPSSCLLLNQVDRAAQAACIINRWLPRGLKRRIILYDIFITTPSRIKQLLVRWMVEGATINVVFSRRQVHGYAEHFGLPDDRFVFIPYKANHSKDPPFREDAGDYVFSGGNSARDYATLVDAVRGTGIPLLISTTRPELVGGLDIPENVEIAEIREPEFARRMAGSRFVVMTLTGGRIRGYGEQTICNSMWQGRPVIAADDVSASDYIREGKTGYVVAPRDAGALRARMDELWGNPERCRRMGEAARRSVRDTFTHRHFIDRMRRLGLVLAASSGANA